MSQFDVKMTELADAIKGKNTNVSGKLSVQGMIDAVSGIVINPPSGEGADVSGVTAKTSDVLNTVKFVDSSGVLQSGTIATVTPSVTANVFSVSKGYVDSDTTLEVPEMTIDNDGETITVPVGYNKTEQTFQVGGGGIDTSDATATASQILDGATAYVNGVKITGNIKTVTATLADNIVTVPAGHIAQAQTLTVAEMAEPSLSGNVVTISKGYNKAQKTLTVAPANAPSISGNTVTIYKGYQSEQKTITIGTAVSAKTYTPGTSNQTIAAGSYLSGVQTIKGDANLIADNIRANKTVFGKTGTFSANATATAADIAEGKTAAVNGEMVTGTLKIASDSEVKFGYWTEDSKFQEIDLSGSAPVNTGSPVTVDAVLFATGQPLPEYSGGSDGTTAHFGFIDDNGKFQPLDLSGSTPVTAGTPIDMAALNMYQTGVAEPNYPTGGGDAPAGECAYYECAALEGADPSYAEAIGVFGILGTSGGGIYMPDASSGKAGNYYNKYTRLDGGFTLENDTANGVVLKNSSGTARMWGASGTANLASVFSDCGGSIYGNKSVGYGEEPPSSVIKVLSGTNDVVKIMPDNEVLACFSDYEYLEWELQMGGVMALWTSGNAAYSMYVQDAYDGTYYIKYTDDADEDIYACYELSGTPTSAEDLSALSWLNPSDSPVDIYFEPCVGSGAEATGWSGYKFEWFDGDGLKVTNAGTGEVNGIYLPTNPNITTDNYKQVYKNESGCTIKIKYDDGSYRGEIYAADGTTMYYNSSWTGKVNNPAEFTSWMRYYGASPTPKVKRIANTFIKSTELTTGLLIEGMMPEVGSTYSADTKVKIGEMA